MKDKIMMILIGVVIVEVLLLTLGSVFAMLGMMDFNTGCIYRYDLTNGSSSASDTVSRHISLRADANYSANVGMVGGAKTIVRDAGSYGRWKRANITLPANQNVDITIDGEMSLCKSYLPVNNIGSNTNIDANGAIISIPRVEDPLTPPVTLIFDAKTQDWRNILELYTGDIVEVILKDNKSSSGALSAGLINNVAETNIFTGQTIVADCSEDKQSYSPICGRWSMWNSKQKFISSCTSATFEDARCGTHCCRDSFLGCLDHIFGGTCYNSCTIDTPTFSTLPLPYKENGSLTLSQGNPFPNVPYTDGICDGSTAGDPGTLEAYANNFVTKYGIANYKYWFSARDAGGLRQRISSTSATAGNDADGIWATIQNPVLDFSPDEYTGRKLYSAQFSNNSATVNYLQYKFYGADHTNYTGGYVFQVKHTKCRRVKGEVISDSYPKRGQILYVVSNTDPNIDRNIANQAQPLPAPKDGATSIVTPNSGDLWLKVDNKFEDYKDSFGAYRINLSYNVGRATFSDKVLTPLLSMIKQRVNISGMQIFQNLLCLKKEPNGSYVHDTINGSCSNFFNYIKAILTLYIITYGLMFLSGIVKASYQDVLIRVAKVGIIAGLLSGQTFMWFNDTIFNFIIGFTDQIIANFGGFHNISSVNNANNAAAPFMFLNTIFTKIFFTQTFAIQLMAVMGIGMVGIIYFIIIGAGVVILIIVGLRAVAVYIIAMVATAFLISLTPIFLTFMLFEQTYYLFEGWYKAVFRFMMEPVILMIGIIVLTQIFTLYLDNVLSYSACWKCSLSFSLPFAGLLPFPGLENIPLFCIYWFGPWGLDNSGSLGQLGMDLSSMLGLVIIAFALYGYADLASSIASRLTSAGGSASSISTGVGMAKSIGQSVLSRVGMDDKTQARLKQEQAHNRRSSRAALQNHEQTIMNKEKALGIGGDDNPLKPGKGGLQEGLNSTKRYGGGIHKIARKVSDYLGITEKGIDHDPLLNPPNPELDPQGSELYNQDLRMRHDNEVDRISMLSNMSGSGHIPTPFPQPPLPLEPFPQPPLPPEPLPPEPFPQPPLSPEPLPLWPVPEPQENPESTEVENLSRTHSDSGSVHRSTPGDTEDHGNPLEKPSSQSFAAEEVGDNASNSFTNPSREQLSEIGQEQNNSNGEVQQDLGDTDLKGLDNDSSLQESQIKLTQETEQMQQNDVMRKDNTTQEKIANDQNPLTKATHEDLDLKARDMSKDTKYSALSSGNTKLNLEARISKSLDLGSESDTDAVRSSDRVPNADAIKEARDLGSSQSDAPHAKPTKILRDDRGGGEDA